MAEADADARELVKNIEKRMQLGALRSSSNTEKEEEMLRPLPTWDSESQSKSRRAIYSGLESLPAL